MLDVLTSLICTSHTYGIINRLKTTIQIILRNCYCCSLPGVNINCVNTHQKTLISVFFICILSDNNGLSVESVALIMFLPFHFSDVIRKVSSELLVWSFPKHFLLWIHGGCSFSLIDGTQGRSSHSRSMNQTLSNVRKHTDSYSETEEAFRLDSFIQSVFVVRIFHMICFLLSVL